MVSTPIPLTRPVLISPGTSPNAVTTSRSTITWCKPLPVRIPTDIAGSSVSTRMRGRSRAFTLDDDRDHHVAEPGEDGVEREIDRSRHHHSRLTSTGQLRHATHDHVVIPQANDARRHRRRTKEAADNITYEPPVPPKHVVDDA